MTQRVLVGDELRSHVNVAKTLLLAEAELRDEEQEPPDREVDDDWFFRWRKLAGGVSSEELQMLWGRVLAGEIKSPGSFSLRTMEFLKNLSQSEAQLIEKVATFIINESFIVAGGATSCLVTEGITVDLLLWLKDLGIISIAEDRLQIRIGSSLEERFERSLVSHDRLLLVQHPDSRKELFLKVYSLTAMGRELFRLGKFSSDEEYLKNVAQFIKAQEFTVSLCRFVPIDADTIRYFDGIEL